jgi:hypothetical protein
MIPCKVYKDLILLYVSEECTEYTRELVDGHLKTCSDCQKYYQDLLEPITQVELEPDLLEEKVKEFEVKKSFLKIRKRWIISLVGVVLILGLTIGIGYLTYNQVRGEGICFTNQDELIMTKSFFKAVQNGNYEEAFSMLDIEKMYKYITSDRVENFLHRQGRFYAGTLIYERSMVEQEALINKVITCTEYYKKMGFNSYKKKQRKEFLRRLEDLKSKGITIKDYTIDAINYMKTIDDDKECWDIDYKVMYRNQEIGWITLRTSKGALLVIGDKWGANMMQSNLYLPEDVDDFYTYTYIGENERWNAELKVNQTPKFTKTYNGVYVQTEAKEVLVITYKGELTDLSSVKHLEISYECNNESNKSVFDYNVGENISSKAFTLNSIIRNGALYDGDEKITVTIVEIGEVKQTLDTMEGVSIGQIIELKRN